MFSLDRITGANLSRRKRIVLAGLVIFAAGAAAAWAVKPGATVKGPSIDRHASLTFPAEPTVASHVLFSIGGTTVEADCGDIPPTDPSPEAGGIQRRVSIAAGPDGAFIAGGNAEGGGFEIPPNSSDALLIDAIGPGAKSATFTSFAVFDGGGTSASGTVALLADDPNDRCVVTAQVAG